MAPCIQPDLYLPEYLYKTIERWVSSKSWYPKKIKLFLAGNKITGKYNPSGDMQRGPCELIVDLHFQMILITRLVSEQLRSLIGFIIPRVFCYIIPRVLWSEKA